MSMPIDRESKLKLYSLGIVVEDKERKSDFIKVTPIEELPAENDLLIDQKRHYDTNVPDAKGIKRSSKVEGDNHLIAKWLPFGCSNRMTSPDVIKGETVIIFRFSDTDDYHWATIMREPKIRRQETVNFSVGNIPSGLVPFDKETSYWIESSTHDKYVQIHTSKNDGELVEYDIFINTEKGYIDIKDDIGNIIKFDSNANTLTAKFNTEIILEAPKITFKASESIINDTPVVINTGNEQTAGVSLANPHVHCVP